MTICPNCGYERQPRDHGFIPETECPRCGIIYDKVGNDGGRPAPPETSQRGKRPGKIKYIVPVVLVGVYGIYYFGITEGYIKKNRPQGETTMFQTVIGLMTPKDPHERLLALAEELVNATQELNRFEDAVAMLEANQIG